MLVGLVNTSYKKKQRKPIDSALCTVEIQFENAIPVPDIWKKLIKSGNDN